MRVSSLPRHLLPCSLATELSDYALTFNVDPATVLTNQTALTEFKADLQVGMASFFGVNSSQVIINSVYATNSTTATGHRRSALAHSSSGFLAYDVDLAGGLWSGRLALTRMEHVDRRSVVNFDMQQVCMWAACCWHACSACGVARAHLSVACARSCYLMRRQRGPGLPMLACIPISPCCIYLEAAVLQLQLQQTHLLACRLSARRVRSWWHAAACRPRRGRRWAPTPPW